MNDQQKQRADEYQQIPQAVIDDLTAHVMGLPETLRQGAQYLVLHIYAQRSKPRRARKKETA